MSCPELLVSNQLCYQIHRLDRLIMNVYRPLLDELGITYPQYMALMAMWEHEELGIGELCSILDLDTGTVSPLVKRLEATGYVQKVRNKKDERAVRVTLTDAGRKLEERARSVPGALASCLLSGEEEYIELKEILGTLIDRLEHRQ